MLIFILFYGALRNAFRSFKTAMKKREKKIIYYTDELNDEFAGDNITPKKIDGSWKYEHKSLWKRFTHFFWYRLVAVPIYFIYLKLKFHHTIKNRKVIKSSRKTGYFMYANHTQPLADAAIPTFVAWPKTTYVIVHPNNVSMPFLGRVTPSMGALPLPDDFNAQRNFIKAIEHKIEKKKAVHIYPEAHIWPYYTGIRPFVDASFHYPIKYDTPVFSFTNTYQKRKFSKKPRLVTYVDGPFYADKSLSPKEQRRQLRDMVYNAMVERAKCSDVEFIEYRKKPSEDFCPDSTKADEE